MTNVAASQRGRLSFIVDVHRAAGHCSPHASNIIAPIVSLRPPPRVPWQITGNHWISLPCVHPADGSVFAAGFLHRGTRSAIELAGGPGFIDGEGPPLFRLRIRLAGKEYAFSDAQMVWERALGWLPTFTWTMGEVVVRGTIFAPFGRDSDAAGAVYALSVENRGASRLDAALMAEGTLGHRQLRVRTERAFESDSHRVDAVDGDVVLGGRSPDALVALAIGADGE